VRRRHRVKSSKWIKFTFDCLASHGTFVVDNKRVTLSRHESYVVRGSRCWGRHQTDKANKLRFPTEDAKLDTMKLCTWQKKYLRWMYISNGLWRSCDWFEGEWGGLRVAGRQPRLLGNDRMSQQAVVPVVLGGTSTTGTTG
jgi:hypothetical protein